MKHLIFYSYNNYESYLQTLNTEITNIDLRNLINTNDVNDLPLIKIDDINTDTNSCEPGYILMSNNQHDSTSLFEDDCKSKCGEKSQLVVISDQVNIFRNNKRLNNGIWCFKEMDQCNLNTSYVISDVGTDKMCVSKYPNLFDNTGFNIVACNDEIYYNNKNVLWDYKDDVLVNPINVIMNDENEKLEDGSYRFRCKYNVDDMMNEYIEHPTNRFHPIQDPCKLNSYRLSEGVKFVTDGINWYCDCGDYSVTRVKNKIINDDKSFCTACYNGYLDDSNLYVIYSECFRVGSKYTEAYNKRPCSDFTNLGSACCHLELAIDIVKNDDELHIPVFVDSYFVDKKVVTPQSDVTFFV